MNIILTGFMACGKSTLARALHQLLGRTLIEMDDLVYQKTETQTMQQVFMKGGELLLRETEIAIAKEYASRQNLIVSTGGGVVLNKVILDYFKETGAIVIFLNAAFELIAERLQKGPQRPLFKNLMEARRAYDFRLPLYLHYADAVIDVNAESAEQIALQIQQKYGF